MVRKLTKIVVLILTLVSLKLNAQSGYHTPSSIVTFASYNEDRSKLLTASADEIILYDCVNKKEIWKLLPSQLNLTMSEYPKISVSIDETLKLLRVCGNKSGCTILDISTWLQGTLEGSLECTANGNNLIWMQSKKLKNGNNYDYYLFDHKSQTKTLLVSNCNKALILPGTNLIGFLFNDKGFNPDNSKTLFYDVSTKKFVKDPIPNFKATNLGLYRNNKRFITASKEKKIFVNDLVEKKFLEINSTHTPVDYLMERLYVGFVAYGWAANTIDVLEYEEKDGLKYSYICSYDLVNGSFLNKIELTNDKEKELALTIVKERLDIINKQNDSYANVNYSVVNNFKSIAGKTLYHAASKHIFTVEANQKPDPSGKVKIKAICHDKKKEVYEFVAVNELVNTSIYTIINNHMTCTHCFGTGNFSNTSERTVWDATISAGAKVIETKTVKGSCINCGGYGKVPVF